MSYKLKVNVPTLAKDALVVIPGLGEYANGKEHKVSDEEMEAYQAYHRRVVTDEDSGEDKIVDVNFVEAFKEFDGIDVTKAPAPTQKNEGSDK